MIIRRKHYGTSFTRQRHDSLTGRACAHAREGRRCQSSNIAIRWLAGDWNNPREAQASNAALSRQLGINVKTVAKWRKRQTVEDCKTSPRDARSAVLDAEEEAVIVAFRRQTLLGLDDCLYALQPTIAHLTRSSLHRCLQRHGIH